ncbi:unnamed protein product [Boreogadus saida]
MQPPALPFNDEAQHLAEAERRPRMAGGGRLALALSPLSSSQSEGGLELRALRAPVPPQRDWSSERLELRETGSLRTQRDWSSESPVSETELRETGAQRDWSSERLELRETGAQRVQSH